jgi:predicted amidohydrolase YtcJ
MKTAVRLGLLCGIFALPCAGWADGKVDAIYANGRIYTGDATGSWAGALAVGDGKIVAVGSDEEIAKHSQPGTAFRNLGGRMVMPGIHDTHLHPVDGGVQKKLQCSFRAENLERVLETLKGCLEDLPAGAWLRGGQWNEGLFPPDVAPKALLDAIAPDHPVFLMDWSVHNAWVNSRALREFGIDDATPDPAGGVIVRDASGQATGILLDNAAYDYRRELPSYPLEDRVAALAWSLERVASYGVTTIKAALVTTPAMEAYAALRARGKLALRVKTSLSWKSAWAASRAAERDLMAARARYADERIDPSFAKIMLDGIPPTYTAALLEPYAPSAAHGSDHRGELMLAPEELAADVTRLDAEGFTIKMHATGDRSARVALDAVAAAREANGFSGLIHEVSHAGILRPDDIPRFKALQVAAEMCPILWYPIPGLDWAHWLGEERAKIWPVKSLLEAGALVIYGSDWPVVPTPNPWPGIEAMVTRSDPAGDGNSPDWPEQAIDLAAALRIFTANGAIANKAGASSGVLAAGRDADFIVLDRNVFEVPITDVGETEVLLSVIGGHTLFDRL